MSKSAPTQRHVLIVGGGPSGTACAISLVRKGYKVTIVDKATFPRDKCCGDGLTTNALRVLESLGFDRGSVPDWQECNLVNIRSPRGELVNLPLPSNGGVFAAIAPREQLDYALVQQARAEGVVIHEGHAFETVTANNSDGVTVSIDGLGEISADYLVAADGMWSPVRKDMGLATPGYLGEWHAFRQYFSNVTGSATNTLHVWFDQDMLPGYAWSFPLPNGRANVGFGILREKDHSVQRMNDMWRDMLQRPHIVEALGPDAVGEGRHTAWPIPARVDTSVRSAGRVLFVGDAVCATDTLTGEGIAQALETGVLAAEAILKGHSPAQVRDIYAKKIDQHFLADHRMSVLLGHMLKRPRIAELALSLVNKSDWTRRNFVRWMFEDEPRAVIFTPRRWHRHFLSRHGAYEAAK